MPRNKNRIYLAFYSRTGHDNYHMALLVSPKNPKSEDKDTWRLHVMNRPNPSLPRTQEDWHYEPALVYARTHRVSALCLLNKTEKSGKEISEMLRSVELVQDDPKWTCKSWAFSAIEYLCEYEFVRLTSKVSLDHLYDIGSRIAREFSEVPLEVRLATPVPTFDSAGQAIKSELK